MLPMVLGICGCGSLWAFHFDQEDRQINKLPVVPHKAAAEVSKIGRYRRGDLL